ncbi:MAG: deoxynucleoside kinase, partial [Halieaceae bacterium]
MREETPSSGLSLRGRSIPTYIAVEGPIGVGKTTLARRIADTFAH